MTDVSNNEESLKILKQQITSQNITQKGKQRVLKRHLFHIDDWNSDFAAKEWSVSKEDFFIVINSLWDISRDKCIKKIFTSTDSEVKSCLIYKMYTSNIIKNHWEKLSAFGIISVSLDDFCSILNKSINEQSKVKAICDLINEAASYNRLEDAPIVLSKDAQSIVNLINYNTEIINHKINYIANLLEKELGINHKNNVKPKTRRQRKQKRKKEHQK